MAARARWDPLLLAFSACHQHPLNNALHLFTTPLGLWGTLSVVGAVHPLAPAALTAVWALWLAARVPSWVWLPSTLVAGGLVALAAWASLPAWAGVVLVFAGNAGQGLAHRISGEQSFEDTYRDRPGRWRSWLEHTLLLLPLVLSCAAQRSPLRWMVAKDRVLHVSLPDPDEDLDEIAAWVQQRRPPRGHTTHWWWHALSPAGQDALQRLAHAPEILDGLRKLHGGATVVEVIDGMNEVYVAGPDQQLTSDTVFYDPHIDGPFSVWPSCTVYRCLIAITPNERVETVFPMGRGPSGIVLDRGAALAFDYNRELHFIRADPDLPQPATPRVVLKVHYLVCPQALLPLGQLLRLASTAYNRIARQVFLDTLTPSTLRERVGAAQVVATTRAFELLERHVGANNLAMVLGTGLACWVTNSMLPALVATSFVHYLLYLAALQRRVGVSFHAFVRDAVFFKAISFTWLGWLYVSEGVFVLYSVALLVVGLALSAWATATLGLTRAHYGAELGVVDALVVHRAPYGIVPHPMFTGQVLGLLAIHVVIAPVVPWLVCVHLALSVLVLAQELQPAPRPLEPG